MATEREVSVETLTCPICLDKIATYVLTECSHSLCYLCIESLHNHSRNIKCPTCRKVITKSPILFQSLAYTMPENTHTRMKSLFTSWFPETSTNVVETFQSSIRNFAMILQESAKKEYEYPHSNNDNWEYIINQINFYNSENIIFDTLSSIVRVNITNNLVHTNILGDIWTFIPFAKPVIIKDKFQLIEKPGNNTLPIPHRRLIAILTNNQVNIIKTLAISIISEMRLRTSNQFYDEISTREEYSNTICIHSGLYNSISLNQNIVIGCRGLWLNRNNYGFRFHVLNSDNNIY